MDSEFWICCHKLIFYHWNYLKCLPYYIIAMDGIYIFNSPTTSPCSLNWSMKMRLLLKEATLQITKRGPHAISAGEATFYLVFVRLAYENTCLGTNTVTRCLTARRLLRNSRQAISPLCEHHRVYSHKPRRYRPLHTEATVLILWDHHCMCGLSLTETLLCGTWPYTILCAAFIYFYVIMKQTNIYFIVEDVEDWTGGCLHCTLPFFWTWLVMCSHENWPDDCSMTVPFMCIFTAL